MSPTPFFKRARRLRHHRAVVAAVALTALAVAAIAIVPYASGARETTPPDAAPPGEYGIWDNDVVPPGPPDIDSANVTLGVDFTSSVAGTVEGIQFYGVSANDGPHQGSLWSPWGRRLATVTFPESSGPGWKTAYLSSPVAINPGWTYTASYVAPAGHYSVEQGTYASGRTVTNRALTALRGTYVYGEGRPRETWHDANYFVDVVFQPASTATTPSSTQTPTPTQTPTAAQTWTPTSTPTSTSTLIPTPTSTPTSIPAPTQTSTSGSTSTQTPTSTRTPTPTPTHTSTPTPTPTPTPTTTPDQSGTFPDASNTGVPAGVALSPYSGPMTITAAGTAIDAKQITGTLTILAPNVTVTRSQINGTVYILGSGSVTITDSNVDAGTSSVSAIAQRNYTLRRVEVVGAVRSAGCDENCVVTDSWLHGQYMLPGSAWHGDGFLSNGGSNMTLRHNTLACDSKPTGSGGACSAALALYGDFGPIEDVTVTDNLFVASPAGYCAYGGYDPSKPYGKGTKGVVMTGNTFARGSNGKCAAFGPVIATAPSGNGNVYSGNAWDDGASVPAA